MEYKFNRKYGFNVYNLQPEDLFEYASSHGLSHIEINFSQEHLAVETFASNRIDKLRSLSETHKVKISFHIPYYINISDILPHVRISNIKYLTKCLQVACKLKATHITLHIGNFFWFPVEQWKRKNALKRFIKNLRTVLKVCEERDVVFALENVVPIPRGSEYYLLGDNIEDFNFIFANVESEYLKFCLDTGHANMSEGALEYVKRFSDKLCCIHYHDNNGFNDDHLPVGQGNILWTELAAELKRIKYDGPIISECRNIKAHESASLLDKYFNETTITD